MNKGMILIALILCACNRTETRRLYVCSPSQRQAAADWMTVNMKAANNMSDEEMEDVISELRKAAICLHCQSRDVVVECQSNGHITRIVSKLDSLEAVTDPYMYW